MSMVVLPCYSNYNTIGQIIFRMEYKETGRLFKTYDKFKNKTLKLMEGLSEEDKYNTVRAASQNTYMHGQRIETIT